MMLRELFTAFVICFKTQAIAQRLDKSNAGIKDELQKTVKETSLM
jgi:hypothetical protein